MFGPLNFPSCEKKLSSLSLDEETVCIACDKNYKFPKDTDSFLEHLVGEHNIVICNINGIANLKEYVTYWRQRINYAKSEPCQQLNRKLREVQSDSTVHSQPDSPQSTLAKDEFLELSEKIPEDKELRQKLKIKQLEFVLDQQKLERESRDYCRGCLFCQTDLSGTTGDYINHLANKHNLILGKPQNLVFIDQFIDTIQEKLLSLRCLYCEKIFKDRNVLKEHMRKKQHKRINPKNTEYDRFYIVNYLEPGKNRKYYKPFNSKTEQQESDSSDSDWSDWREDVQVRITCLFCENSYEAWEDTLRHMKNEHEFDYMKSTCNLGFYQQVKLINYIRRQVHRLRCITCDKEASDITSLSGHMRNEGHFILPDKSLWDQPEYYFPTYENDPFLCQIDDPYDNGSQDSSGVDVKCDSD